MKLLKVIYNFLGEVGRIRAATHLSHRGDYAGAKKIVSMKEFKGWI